MLRLRPSGRVTKHAVGKGAGPPSRSQLVVARPKVHVLPPIMRRDAAQVVRDGGPATFGDMEEPHKPALQRRHGAAAELDGAPPARAIGRHCGAHCVRVLARPTPAPPRRWRRWRRRRQSRRRRRAAAAEGVGAVVVSVAAPAWGGRPWAGPVHRPPARGDAAKARTLARSVHGLKRAVLARPDEGIFYANAMPR